MDKKKLLFIIGLVLIVILGVIAINISKKNKATNEVDDLNESILKDTIIDGIKITDQSVITRDGQSTYMANVTNTNSETVHFSELTIVFTLKGKNIESLAAKNVDLNAGKTMPVTIVFDDDISKATKVDYKITKD